jgi:hypothetical protein
MSLQFDCGHVTVVLLIPVRRIQIARCFTLQPCAYMVEDYCINRPGELVTPVSCAAVQRRVHTAR